jgi:hypothetical protein
VVKLGNQDFITGLQVSANGAGETVIESGHVLAKRDAVCIMSTQKSRNLSSDIGHHLVGFLSGNELTMRIRIGGSVIIAYRLNNAIRNLCACWSIQKNQRLSINFSAECRKLTSDVCFFHVLQSCAK